MLSGLGSSLLATGAQLLILLGPLGAAVVCLNVSSALVMRQALGLLGPRAFLFVFGWLGTAVHELSHALFCLLFGHRILELKLFDPGASDGSLGYVRHAYNRLNPYHQLGNLFIAAAPVIVGAALLTLGGVALLGGDLHAVFQGASRMTGGTHGFAELAARALGGVRSLGALALGSAGAGCLRAAAFAYVTISIGSLMSMSRPDAVGALPGLATVALLLLLANVAALLLTGDTLTGRVWSAALGLWFVYSILIAAVAMNLVAALALFLARSVIGLVRGR
jgi:hypothetical protein